MLVLAWAVHDERLEPVRSKYLKKFSQAITEALLLAKPIRLIIHPHYLGQNLGPERKEMGTCLMESRDSQLVPPF